MSSRQRRSELIAFGFSRNNFEQMLPIVIINLIQQFYDMHFHWQIKGKLLKKFLSTPHKEHLKSQSFNIHNIEFEMRVFPNGHIKSATGYIGYFLCVKQIPDHIDYFSLYLQLECELPDGTVYAFKDIVKWRKGDEECSDGWYSQPKLADCQHANVVHFNCLLDFLYIKYKATSASTMECIDYVKDLQIARQCKYYWIVNEKEMQRFKREHAKIAITSPSFGNDAWCLEIIPNGDRFLVVEKAAMFIKALAIPFGVKEIVVAATLCRDDAVQVHLDDVRLSHARNNMGVWIGEIIQKSYQTCMVLSCELQIKQMFDEKGKEIHISHWKQYGILE